MFHSSECTKPEIFPQSSRRTGTQALSKCRDHGFCGSQLLRRQFVRIIAQVWAFYFNHFGIMARGRDGLRSGAGESAEFPTGLKEVVAMFAFFH